MNTTSRLKIIKISTLILFVILLITRVVTRIHSGLWTDEVEEIRNLTSIRHLLVEYLPSIPGGSPGHYLLILPINLMFGVNKYLLGLPGLLSHILVFILIPAVIKRLKFIDKNSISFCIFLTRIAFVFDPTFVFQAMEVRPYSILPLFWVFSFFTVYSLFNNIYYKHVNRCVRFLRVLLNINILFLISIWHYYGILMIISIVLFFFISRNNRYERIMPLFISLFIPLITVIPMLLYFSPGSNVFHFDTLEMLKSGFGRWQNYLYGFMFISVFLYLLKTNFVSKNLKKFIILTVLFPISVILFLDIHNRYWFLLRQFAWTLLPFYISIAVILIRIKRHIVSK